MHNHCLSYIDKIYEYISKEYQWFCVIISQNQFYFYFTEPNVFKASSAFEVMAKQIFDELMLDLPVLKVEKDLKDYFAIALKAQDYL